MLHLFYDVSQPREWNYLVTPAMSWADRWRAFKLLLPLTVFVAICGAEMAFFRFWMDDLLSEKWPNVLMLPLFAIGILVLAAEAAAQIERRSRRVLKVEDRAVWIQPARQGRIEWKNVLEWRFEPEPRNPNATRLTLVYAWSKKRTRQWPMPLNKADRETLFIELAERKQNGADFQITEADEPTAPIEAKGVKSLPGLWLLMFGYFLFLHSSGPLLVGLNMDSSSGAASGPPSKNMERFAKRYIAPYFSSAKDLREFALRTGIAFASSGVLFMVWGTLRGRTTKQRASPATAANLTQGQACT